RPPGSTGGSTCGAGFMPASGPGSGCRVGPTTVGRDKPGPTKRNSATPAPAAGPSSRLNWWGNLWGRLYAGQRGQVQVAVSAPPPSARTSPAPQKEIPLHPAPAAATDRWAQRVTQPVGPALCRPAGPGSSCRVGPTAVGRDEPGPTKRTSAT